jgi:D-alanyl-lipoteichoic acid acyltransferase DltB (MBOAT superfamily)
MKAKPAMFLQTSIRVPSIEHGAFVFAFVSVSVSTFTSVSCFCFLLLLLLLLLLMSDRGDHVKIVERCLLEAEGGRN